MAFPLPGLAAPPPPAAAGRKRARCRAETVMWTVRVDLAGTVTRRNPISAVSGGVSSAALSQEREALV
eukprot:SAG22_NODE_1498_length_4288_cov_3.110289_9_plen_68_part_00